MNNKGFISTSLVYSLFIVFILMITLVLSLYTNNRVLLNKEKEALKASLYNITVSNSSELLIGDEVTISNNKFIVVDIINDNYYLLYNDENLLVEDHLVEGYVETLNFTYETRLMTSEEAVKYKTKINTTGNYYTKDQTEYLIYDDENNINNIVAEALIIPLVIISTDDEVTYEIK